MQLRKLHLGSFSTAGSGNHNTAMGWHGMAWADYGTTESELYRDLTPGVLWPMSILFPFENPKWIGSLRFGGHTGSLVQPHSCSKNHPPVAGHPRLGSAQFTLPLRCDRTIYHVARNSWWCCGVVLRSVVVWCCEADPTPALISRVLQGSATSLYGMPGCL